MPLVEAGLNVGASAIRTAITHNGLAAADPGATGTNAAAAARQAVTWGTVSAGDFTSSAAVNFTGGTPNGPVTHVTFWSAATGGTYYGSQALTGDNTFNSAGEYTVSSVSITS